jgi:hypothetical protein
LRHYCQKPDTRRLHVLLIAPVVALLVSILGTPQSLSAKPVHGLHPASADLTATPTRTATRTQTPTATATRTRMPTSTVSATVTRIPGGRIWKVMPLGDSLTQGGEYAATPHYAYRRPLQTLLTDGGYEFDFVGSQYGPSRPELGAYDDDHEGWVNFSTGGVDTVINASGVRMGITDNITGFLDAQTPDIVLLQIGINDIFSPTRVSSPLTITQRLSRLVDIIRNQEPDALIFVGSLMPMPGGTTPEIDAMNAHIAAFASVPGDRLLYVDLASTSLSSRDWVDLVHLSQSGAQKIAARWYAAISAAISPDAATPAPSTPTPTRPPGLVRSIYMPLVRR